MYGVNLDADHPVSVDLDYDDDDDLSLALHRASKMMFIAKGGWKLQKLRIITSSKLVLILTCTCSIDLASTIDVCMWKVPVYTVKWFDANN